MEWKNSPLHGLRAGSGLGAPMLEQVVQPAFTLPLLRSRREERCPLPFDFRVITSRLSCSARVRTMRNFSPQSMLITIRMARVATDELHHHLRPTASPPGGADTTPRHGRPRLNIHTHECLVCKRARDYEFWPNMAGHFSVDRSGNRQPPCLCAGRRGCPGFRRQSAAS